MKNKVLSVLLIIACAANAQVTKVGNDTLLDVGSWNTEWFGDVENGPSNEALQYTNVKTVLNNTDVDAWGLAEVSNPTTFNSLLTDLPAYDGVLSSFSQTQKMAMIWKKSKFDMVSYTNVLTAQSYNYDFAGRPPLEVILKTKGSADIDTLYFYVLHLKANSGDGDQSSYDRRKGAVGSLKTYLDQNRAGKKVLVIGDWNDDVDQSVVYIGSSYLQTPFQNFLNDSSHYFFASKRLSLAGEKSYVFGNQMIDQQMISVLMKDSFYVANSSQVLSQLSSQITNYGNSTSDHYPILTRYNLKRYPKLPPVGISEAKAGLSFSLYPNPANTYITVQADTRIKTIELLNSMGETVMQTSGALLDIASVPAGIYFVKLTGDIGFAVRKIVVNH